jgi:hypothetical protein
LGIKEQETRLTIQEHDDDDDDDDDDESEFVPGHAMKACRETEV